jgi:DNA/RNA endonuclease YhcR with UshA esterase domain
MSRKRIALFAALIFTLSIGFAVVAAAQTQPPPGPRMRGPRYDPATEMTVKGTVEEVQQITGRRGWGGTHLMLKTDQGTLDVHLGPASFVKQQGFEFAKGDELQVIGSKVKYGQGEALIARQVAKGDKTLTLRDAHGYPAWSRGGGRRAPRNP